MSHWIFGYGSLVWRPDFNFETSEIARLRGYARRFWQGSSDHRGVPGAPGRVVTLVVAPGSATVGRAYRVTRGVWEQVMEKLDRREQGGYERHSVTLELISSQISVDAVVYLAGRDNPHFLGPASPDEMAAQIAGSEGPSGRNDEYLFELERWLASASECDPHVSALAERVRRIRG